MAEETVYTTDGALAAELEGGATVDDSRGVTDEIEAQESVLREMGAMAAEVTSDTPDEPESPAIDETEAPGETTTPFETETPDAPETQTPDAPEQQPLMYRVEVGDDLYLVKSEDGGEISKERLEEIKNFTEAMMTGNMVDQNATIYRPGQFDIAVAGPDGKPNQHGWAEDLTDEKLKRQLDAQINTSIERGMAAQTQINSNPGMMLLMMLASFMGGRNGRDVETDAPELPGQTSQLQKAETLQDLFVAAGQTPQLTLDQMESLTAPEQMAALAMTENLIGADGQPISDMQRAEMLNDMIAVMPANVQLAMADRLQKALIEGNGSVINDPDARAALANAIERMERQAEIYLEASPRLTPDGTEYELTWNAAGAPDGKDNFKVEIDKDIYEALDPSQKQMFEQFMVLKSMEQTPEIVALQADLLSRENFPKDVSGTFDNPGLFNNLDFDNIEHLINKNDSKIRDDAHHRTDLTARQELAGIAAGTIAYDAFGNMNAEAAPEVVETVEVALVAEEVEPTTEVPVAPEWVPGYHDGMTADLVADLNAMGAEPPLAADAEWSAEPENPVRESIMELQTALGISPTGILDSDTYNAIQDALDTDAQLGEGLQQTQAAMVSNYAEVTAALDTIQEAALQEGVQLNVPDGMDMSAVEVRGEDGALQGYDLNDDGVVDANVDKDEAIAFTYLSDLQETFGLSEAQQTAIEAMKSAFIDASGQEADTVSAAIGGVNAELAAQKEANSLGA